MEIMTFVLLSLMILVGLFILGVLKDIAVNIVRNAILKFFKAVAANVKQRRQASHAV